MRGMRVLVWLVAGVVMGCGGGSASIPVDSVSTDADTVSDSVSGDADLQPTDTLPGDHKPDQADVQIPDQVDQKDLGQDVPDVETDADIEVDVNPCGKGCDDGDPCTTDTCVPGVGCEYAPVAGCCDMAQPLVNDFEAETALDGWTIATTVPPYTDKPDLASFSWSRFDGRAHASTWALYFGDPLTKAYDNGHRVAATATSPAVQLAENARYSLSVWVYLGIEEGKYSDFFSINVVVDGKTIRIWAKSDTEATNKWTNLVIDLSAFAGKSIQVQFAFDSNDEHENGLEGVYVDNVSLDRNCSSDLSCSTAAGCNDMNVCTKDECKNGTCQFTYDSACCLTPSECEDWDGCTLNKCTNNVCQTQPDPDPLCCNSSDVCHDEDDICTTDVCRNTRCEFLPSGEPGCCTEDAHCNDNDSCTIDHCIDKTCTYVPLCCTVDSDCNDGDDTCTTDACEAGKCKYFVSAGEGCCAPQLVYEDFEDGMAQGFLFNETNPTQMKWVVGQGDAYQGNQSMFINALGISSSISAEAVLPVAQIPPVGGKLTFYMKQTLEASGECSENKLVVKFEAVTLQTECNTIADWYKVTVPLDAVAGQQGALSIAFYASPYSSSAYQVWVDKVVIEQQCCSANADCNDENPCTADSCPGSNSVCQFVPIEGCCLTDSACNDGDECTDDRCVDNWCAHINECCASDAECNDNDDICTIDHCLNNRCYFEPTGVAGCCVPDQYMETFEGGLIGWDVSDPNAASRWRISNTDTVSGTQSLYFGNETGTGYANSVDGFITGPLVDIPSAPGVALSFQAKYNTESPDKFRVYFQTTDGVDHQLAEMSGTQNDWTLKTYSLQTYAGQAGHIKFGFHSDSSITYLGVFVDDVAITIDCCSSDSECDDNNPCTQDSCPGTEAMCVNLPWEGCCISNSGCADGDPCTVDTCTEQNTCTNIDVCCESDAECNDGDDLCTEDLCVGNFCFFSPTGTPGCCVPEAFAERFDGGSLAANWTAQNPGTGDTWQIGTTHVVSAPGSLYFGNSSQTGYSSSVDASLTLKEPFDVPVSDTVALQFQVYCSTENSYDKLAVYIVDGTTETKLGEVMGQATAFQAKSYSLVAFKGKSVRIKFTFHSDGSSTYQGVWLDDLVVTRECCDTDADCNDDNVCTVDSCPGPVSNCIFAPITDCCQDETECDDANECTVDTCTEEHVCTHVDECCSSDLECDDGNDTCTQDVCVNNRCQFLPTGAPGCCLSQLFFDGFESGNLDGYTITNDADSAATWHITNSSSVNGSKALVFSNADESNYGSYVDATLETPVTSIPVNAISPKLSYSVRYYTESCCDRLTVFVVSNGVETQVAEYKGTAETWVAATFPLDTYKGKDVSIRLKFHSDSGINYWGVMLDNLTVGQDCCSSSSQCNDNDPCTTDVCPGPNSGCINEQIPGCCVVGNDCVDNDPCTLGVCSAAHLCSQINLCCDSADDCNDGNDLCTVDACTAGTCTYTPTGVAGCCQPPLFADSFETDKGWTYEGQWERGPAAVSTCAESPLKNDPAADHTSTEDNYIAGLELGGCLSETTLYTWYYMTSPVIDTSLAPALYLSFWRVLNSDSYLYADARVEVWDGASWVKVWGQNSQATTDAGWTYVEYNITPYKSADFRIRFGVEVLSAAGKAASSWNIDDLRLFTAASTLCCTLDSECEGSGAVCLGGQCVDKCVAGCMGKECGPNPCGGTCGTCPNGTSCQADGMCCSPQCDGLECGADGCGGTCGSCGYNQACTSGLCGCVDGSVGCGEVCCDVGDVCYEDACCTPSCDGAECGDDGCGSLCGTCGNLEQCVLGLCQCDWEMLPLDGEFYKVNSLTFVPATDQGVGFDVDDNPDTCSPNDGCTDGVDNAFAGFLANSPQADFNLLLLTLMEEGALSPLVQVLKPSVDELDVAVVGGLPEAPLSTCDHLTMSCPHWVLQQSVDQETCSVPLTWNDAVYDSPKDFSAGNSAAVVRLPMRLASGDTFVLNIYSARMQTALHDQSPDFYLEGLIGGAVKKDDVMAWVNALPLTAGMTPSKLLLRALIEVFLVPDIDLDGDGEMESCSLALYFTAIPTETLGVEAP